MDGEWTAQHAMAIPARVSRAPPAQTAHADCLDRPAPTPLAVNDVGDMATRAPCCGSYFQRSSDGLPGRAARAARAEHGGRDVLVRDPRRAAVAVARALPLRPLRRRAVPAAHVRAGVERW